MTPQEVYEHVRPSLSKLKVDGRDRARKVVLITSDGKNARFSVIDDERLTALANSSRELGVIQENVAEVRADSRTMIACVVFTPSAFAVAGLELPPN